MENLDSRERMKLFYSGEKIDRIPMLSCATMYSGYRKGLSSSEFYFDVKKSYHSQKEIIEENGYDDLPCFDLPSGEMLDFGGEMIISSDERVSLPLVKKYAIESIEDAWNFQLPPMSERKFTKLNIEFLKYAQKQGQFGVSICAGSPFTMVGSMVKTDLLLRWVIKEKEAVHHLLEIAKKYLLETADLYIKEFGIERCSVSSNYPFESNGLISPKIFERFAYPSMMEIHEELRSRGLKNFGIHLCGNHSKNLEFFKDLNLPQRSFISSDEANSLKLVSETLGKYHIYGGNVSTNLLVNGSAEQVYQQSREIIRDMKYNEGGFALMPSCDLPINTKPENLVAMKKSVYDFGRY